MLKNIKECKKLFNSLSSEILDSIGDGVIAVDLQGKIFYINDIAEKIIGYEEDLAINQSIYDAFYIINKETRKKEESPYDIVLREGSIVGLRKNTVLISKDGKEKYISASSSPMRDEENELKAMVIVFRDITRIKQAEEELKRAKIQAEAANIAKSQFLSNMSHEIRTPMNGIIGMTNLTLLTDLDSEQRENLELVRNSAETLLHIINDILDISKIDSGNSKLFKSKFNLKELITKINRFFEIELREKGLKYNYYIDSDIPNTLYGDRSRIEQVLINIVGNAIKFTKKGSVSLEFRYVSCRDNIIKLEVSISDTGIGIDESDLKYLFDDFTQADSSYTRKFGGTGTGLAISRRIVKMMDGNISVYSEKDKGSIFKFDLNIESFNEIKKENINKESNHILLVEDNEINRVMTKKLLEKKGYIVEVACNGKESVDILKENIYDIILMDIQMPVMDGLEATKIIREIQKKEGVYTPIVALTAYVLNNEREKFIKEGVDEFVAKPIDLEELLGKINELTKK